MNNQSAIQQFATTSISTFFAKVYGWMSLGLLVSFGTAFALYYFLIQNFRLTEIFYSLFPFIMLAQITVVLILSFIWRKLNGLISGLLFIFYSFLTGLFLGIIFLGYEINSIILAFGATGLTFVAMSLYGFLTKQDLTRIGNIALMGLFGLIIASVVNLIAYFFFPGFAQGFSWVLTYIGLGIFIILIAYDSQKLKKLADEAETLDAAGKYAVQGALMLYLDFINIFIRILAIMGRRR